MAVPLIRGRLIRDQYSQWLQTYFWDYFVTVTFRSPRKEPYYALQHVWHSLQNYNVARAFLACEPFKSGGDIHVHGIVAGRSPGWRPEVRLPWEIWQGLFNRFGRSKVELCNSLAAVSNYCTNYILKDQSSSMDYYELFGDKFAWQQGKLPADLTSVI
jgi:hypothetical protein